MESFLFRFLFFKGWSVTCLAMSHVRFCSLTRRSQFCHPCAPASPTPHLYFTPPAQPVNCTSVQGHKSALSLETLLPTQTHITSALCICPVRFWVFSFLSDVRVLRNSKVNLVLSPPSVVRSGEYYLFETDSEEEEEDDDLKDEELPRRSPFQVLSA